MSLNPYAPPSAAVADIEHPDDVKTQPPFFAVSITKFIVMNICTAMLYEFYWFYRHWKRIAEREHEALSPVLRAIFAVIFCYPCFARMRDHEAAEEAGVRLHAGPLAIGWIVCTLTWRLPEPYDWISVAAFLFLIPVQRYANRLNAFLSPSHDRNSRFSAWNWVAIVLFGSLLLLAVAGALMPPVEE